NHCTLERMPHAAVRPSFGRVALIGKLRSAEIAQSLRELREMLEQRGCEVLIERETASDLGLRGVDYAAIGAEAKLAIVVGADGVIVATPTGSTAYAMSAQGPILHPAVPAFALVPLNPHTLSARPVSVSDRMMIEIVLVRALDARAHFDGFALADMQQGDRLLLKRSADAVRFVHPPGYSCFATLREKLRWSEVLEKNRDLE